LSAGSSNSGAAESQPQPVDPGEGATTSIHRPLWTLVMIRVDPGEQEKAENQRVGLVIPWTWVRKLIVGIKYLT